MSEERITKEMKSMTEDTVANMVRMSLKEDQIREILQMEELVQQEMIITIQDKDEMGAEDSMMNEQSLDQCIM